MDTCICLSMKNSVILSNDKFACFKKFVHEKKKYNKFTCTSFIIKV